MGMILKDLDFLNVKLKGYIYGNQVTMEQKIHR